MASNVCKVATIGIPFSYLLTYHFMKLKSQMECWHLKMLAVKTLKKTISIIPCLNMQELTYLICYEIFHSLWGDPSACLHDWNCLLLDTDPKLSCRESRFCRVPHGKFFPHLGQCLQRLPPTLHLLSLPATLRKEVSRTLPGAVPESSRWLLWANSRVFERVMFFIAKRVRWLHRMLQW